MKFRKLFACIAAASMMLSVAACSESKKADKKDIPYYTEEEFVSIAKSELGLSDDNFRFLEDDGDSQHICNDIYFQYNTAIAIAQYFPDADSAHEQFVAFQEEATVDEGTHHILEDNYMTIDGELTISDDEGNSVSNTLYQAMYLSDNVIIQVFAQDGTDASSRAYVDEVITAYGLPSVR